MGFKINKIIYKLVNITYITLFYRYIQHNKQKPSLQIHILFSLFINYNKARKWAREFNSNDQY